MNFKNDGIVPEGIIFSDLGAMCEPAENITTRRVKDKWESIPYETATISGTMLSAFKTMAPKPVTLNPELTGWYKIFVSLMNNKSSNMAFLRLTDDEAQTSICPSGVEHRIWWQWENFEETFWKCADMTGQSVEICRRNAACVVGCHIAWIRFVPMTEAEVEQWKYEQERTDTKRLFATHDMFSAVAVEGHKTKEDWLSVIEGIKYSDVECLALDTVIFPDDYVDEAKDENYAFFTEDRKELYYELIKKHEDLYVDLVKAGQRNGLKMYAGRRMGVKIGGAFPYDGEDFGVEYGQAHMHLRCKNRNGVWVDSISMAYPEVQEHVVKELLELPKLGVDGIFIIFTRGVFMLFEEPFIERFKQKYPDVNPCELPLDDERVMDIHCEIMTELMRKIRKAVDEECERLGRGPIAIHTHVGRSLKSNRMIGLDIEQWAKEKLIQGFTAYPMSIYERLDGVMKDDNPELIDLEKYTKKSREEFHKIVHREVEGPDARHIELEYVKEYVEMAKKYDVKPYFDVMFRDNPAEKYCEDALRLIEQGAEYFGLWDCDYRMVRRSQWGAASRLGHIEELKNGTLIQNPSTVYRILSIDGKNISTYHPSWIG